MFHETDTIVAIATPPGRGGVGIVRLSGPSAAEISRKLFRSQSGSTEWPSHQLVYGSIYNPESGEKVDDGLLVFMPLPHSYTGEDVVEFQMHGSPIALEMILSLCKTHGARLAEAGEFTKRAFLRGKLDLVQAEAVAELIHAESEAEALQARKRLEGELSNELETLRQGTIEVLAELEADVDFPDENLPLSERSLLLNKIKENQILSTNILDTYDANRRLQSGYSVAFVGRPNVGKSSLFNSLLRSDRAIVTSIPGTTRDVLREELVLDGRRVRLIDTAGLRMGSDDTIEKLGMDRTALESEKADLVCLLLSADEGLTKADEEMLERLPKKKLWVLWNKIDLRAPPSSVLPGVASFTVSALRGDGLDRFRQALSQAAVAATTISGGGIANERQRDLMDEYISAIVSGLAQAEKNVSPEFVAFEFRQAYRAISRILGKDEDMEEILDEIFSRFCVGK